jgi:hypothetical protein
MVSTLVRAGCGSVVGVPLEARIAELEVLISGLGVEVERLQTENTASRARVEVHDVENAALRAEIVSLKSKGSNRVIMWSEALFRKKLQSLGGEAMARGALDLTGV